MARYRCSDCDCCCNSSNRKCYQSFIIFSSILIFAFQMIIVIVVETLIKPEEIESTVLSETPLYDFEISDHDIINKKNISFFNYKGRKKKKGNKTEIVDEKIFTKIFQNKFFYNGKDKNYFDYKNNYTVSPGNNCFNNYKKCGILDQAGNILCLPDNEDCPLNGFWISDIASDPEYIGYECKEVYDSIDNSNFYIYYTNNNTDGEIITEFKLSAGIPCAMPTESNWQHYYDEEVEENYICESFVNGNKNSYRYSQVSYGIINFRSLYKDNGLTDPPDNYYVDNFKAYLFVRNYNEIDEKCFKDFLRDIENEKKYYDSILSVIRILGAISLAFIVAIFIYMIVMCYYIHLSFFSILLILPLYGILFNIITLVLINKAKIKYSCQKDGFNEIINEIISQQYTNNNTLNIAMSSLSLAFYIIVFIFSLCLNRTKNNIIEGATTTAIVPVIPFQPGYPQMYAVPYGQNNFYQNMMVPPGSNGISLIKK